MTSDSSRDTGPPAGSAVSDPLLEQLRAVTLGVYDVYGELGRGGTGANRPDVILATGGFDQPVSSWATLAVDVISEWELGEEGLVLPSTVTYEFPVVRSIEPTNIPALRDHRVSGSLGFKFRTPGGPILVTNALVPLRRAGLVANLIWTVGLDANF